MTETISDICYSGALRPRLDKCIFSHPNVSRDSLASDLSIFNDTDSDTSLDNSSSQPTYKLRKPATIKISVTDDELNSARNSYLCSPATTVTPGSEFSYVHDQVNNITTIKAAGRSSGNHSDTTAGNNQKEEAEAEAEAEAEEYDQDPVGIHGSILHGNDPSLTISVSNRSTKSENDKPGIFNKTFSFNTSRTPQTPKSRTVKRLSFHAHSSSVTFSPRDLSSLSRNKSTREKRRSLSILDTDSILASLDTASSFNASIGQSSSVKAPNVDNISTKDFFFFNSPGEKSSVNSRHSSAQKKQTKTRIKSSVSSTSSGADESVGTLSPLRLRRPDPPQVRRVSKKKSKFSLGNFSTLSLSSSSGNNNNSSLAPKGRSATLPHLDTSSPPITDSNTVSNSPTLITPTGASSPFIKKFSLKLRRGSKVTNNAEANNIDPNFPVDKYSATKI